MKKREESKLGLNKFTVSKLDNLENIKGGDGQDKGNKKSEDCPPPPPPPSGIFCPPRDDN